MAALLRRRGKGKKGPLARKRHLNGELSAKVPVETAPAQATWTFMRGFHHRVFLSGVMEPITLSSFLVWAFPVVVMAIVNCYGAGSCVIQHANTLQ